MNCIFVSEIFYYIVSLNSDLDTFGTQADRTEKITEETNLKIETEINLEDSSDTEAGFVDRSVPEFICEAVPSISFSDDWCGLDIDPKSVVPLTSNLSVHSSEGSDTSPSLAVISSSEASSKSAFALKSLTLPETLVEKRSVTATKVKGHRIITSLDKPTTCQYKCPTLLKIGYQSRTKTNPKLSRISKSCEEATSSKLVVLQEIMTSSDILTPWKVVKQQTLEALDLPQSSSTRKIDESNQNTERTDASLDTCVLLGNLPSRDRVHQTYPDDPDQVEDRIDSIRTGVSLDTNVLLEASPKLSQSRHQNTKTDPDGFFNAQNDYKVVRFKDGDDVLGRQGNVVSLTKDNVEALNRASSCQPDWMNSNNSFSFSKQKTAQSFSTLYNSLLNEKSVPNNNTVSSDIGHRSDRSRNLVNHGQVGYEHGHSLVSVKTVSRDQDSSEDEELESNVKDRSFDSLQSSEVLNHLFFTFVLKIVILRRFLHDYSNDKLLLLLILILMGK